jgi:NADPH2:quinone reductase
MRSVVLKRFGHPREVLAVEDRPVPEPGPGQIRLKTVLSPIHNHDLAIIRGVYGYKPTLPAIVGSEALGVVDRLGPGVEHLAVGQRVAAMGQGAWAEYSLAAAATAVPVPPGVPDEGACQLVAMPFSAYLLIEDLALRPGEWMIQNAAGGAVGRIVNTLAREREIKVINLVRRQSSAGELAAEGVEHLLATDDPEWPSKVAAETGGAPVLRALDSVGGKAANDLMSVLAPGGVLVSFGALSGHSLSIDPGHLIFKQTTVKGFWASPRAAAASPADRVRMVTDLVRLIAAGKLPLRVAATYELGEVAEAVVASETPGRLGKVALKVA